MSTTVIKEPINVIAVFDSGLRPVKFKWKGKIYPISEITYRWSSREGSSTIVHFSVTDGATLYELAYNTATMKWILERTEA